jgi:hypothetical protein
LRQCNSQQPSNDLLFGSNGHFGDTPVLGSNRVGIENCKGYELLRNVSAVCPKSHLGVVPIDLKHVGEIAEDPDLEACFRTLTNLNLPAKHETTSNVYQS